MRIAFLVAAIAALVAAAAWALASSKPANKPYTVEVSDVAGVRGFTVTPEVVVQANLMPEVVVRRAPDEVRSQMPEARGQKSGRPCPEEV